MQYHIARDNQQLGQFSEEEIRAGLFEGRYLPSDLVWNANMSGWKPASEVFPQVSRPTPPAIPSATFAPGRETFGGGASQTSGMAITALCLGIVSLLTCGLMGVGALAAIICGHIALSKIKESESSLRGRGMAMSGLIMGYVCLILVGLSLAAALTTPMFSKLSEIAPVSKSVMNATLIVSACKTYASTHDGAYPKTLEELVELGLITDANVLKDPLSKDGAANGYEYFGGQMSTADSAEKILFMSKTELNGKRIIVKNDGLVSYEAFELSPP